MQCIFGGRQGNDGAGEAVWRYDGGHFSHHLLNTAIQNRDAWQPRKRLPLLPHLPSISTLVSVDPFTHYIYFESHFPLSTPLEDKELCWCYLVEIQPVIAMQCPASESPKSELMAIRDNQARARCMQAE